MGFVVAAIVFQVVRVTAHGSPASALLTGTTNSFRYEIRLSNVDIVYLGQGKCRGEADVSWEIENLLSDDDLNYQFHYRVYWDVDGGNEPLDCVHQGMLLIFAQVLPRRRITTSRIE